MEKNFKEKVFLYNLSRRNKFTFRYFMQDKIKEFITLGNKAKVLLEREHLKNKIKSKKPIEKVFVRLLL